MLLSTNMCDNIHVHVHAMHMYSNSLNVLLLILFTYVELHPDVELEITRIENMSGQRRVIFHTSVSTQVYHRVGRLYHRVGRLHMLGWCQHAH